MVRTMEIAAFILLALGSAVCVGVQSLTYLHMLQLNSYRNERYLRWCRGNLRTLFFPLRLLPLPGLLGFLLFPGAAGFVQAGLLALTGPLNRPPKAKKPLVYTARIKRLLAAVALLWAVAVAVAWFLPLWGGALLLTLISLPVWLIVLLANTLNLPMERAITAWYVRDARRRLAAMSRLTVIGVTGSYGKTSVKNYLHALLSAKYNVLMTPESYNTTLGVVRTIRERLRPTHEIFIVEMGAKNPGDIREICELVHPRYGVITSIGEQHLETFRSIDNIIRTKFELADAIPSDGAVFLNYDNPYIRNHPVACRAVTYGREAADADYAVQGLATDGEGSAFTIRAPGGETRAIRTRLLGAHTVQNLAGCIAAAHTLGVPLDDLVYPVRMLQPVAHRLQLLPNGYIDDAYNANPAGFRAALDVLAGFAGQRVLVTPGMVELGDRQEALNRELGAYAATRCDVAVLVGERQAPPLQAGLLDGGFPPENIFVAKTLQEGLTHLNTLPAPQGRIVLLENDLPDNF